MNTNYRLILIYTWCICYLIILSTYMSRIHSGDNPFTNSFERLISLFGIVSAIIVPQIGIMFSFFFEYSNEQIRTILETRPNAKIAYAFSIFYILLFTILIVLGVGFQVLLDWKINEATTYIVLIMGHLAFFVTLPLRHLFK